MKRLSWKRFMIIIPVTCILFLSGPSFASACMVEYRGGQNPYIGSTMVMLTNTTMESWGSFHFQVFSTGYPVSNVDFIVSAAYRPTGSQNPLTWVVDNSPVTGSTLDLFFYGDPVLPGQSAWFRIYTDNSVDRKPFGVLFYPTPVPVPASLLLFAAGLLGLVCMRWRPRPAIRYSKIINRKFTGF